MLYQLALVCSHTHTHTHTQRERERERERERYGTYCDAEHQMF